VQTSCPGTEFLHRLICLPCIHGHKMAFIPDINSGYIPMHNFPSRLLGLQLPLDLSALTSA
jgi:hypothetical protein